MKFAESIYEALTDEEDARLCKEIGEDACQEAPQSFVFILFSYCLTKLGDAIASPKTTLAWLVSVVGAPAFVLGLLVPIRESGSMIPQLFIGGIVRGLSVRKWVWVAGSAGQAACIVGIGFVAISLSGAAAGWAILGLVILFSLFRGFCSVAAKDVLGKTIPKRKRGQLNGWSASAAGLLGIGVGIILMMPASGELGRSFLGILLFGAGLLWLVAAAIYSGVSEYPGETGGGRNILDALGQLRLLATDAPFRRFVTTRALLMCSALSAPFYIALAQQRFGSPGYLLGAFIIAAGVAGLVSAPVWGRYADASSKSVMISAALITSGIGLAVFLVSRFLPDLGGTLWFLPVTYFVLSLAHSGVRVGRKTYVVNLASGNKRTDYVAISNTVIGVLLLMVGAVGALSPLIGNDGVIGLLALMGLAGAAYGTTLPDV
ncbi:MAG: MFS transporter [Gammaproteobacteria bacterium]|nr:MFS transporter [Gammaproteobacteria bacterium]